MLPNAAHRTPHYSIDPRPLCKVSRCNHDCSPNRYGIEHLINALAHCSSHILLLFYSSSHAAEFAGQERNEIGRRAVSTRRSPRPYVSRLKRWITVERRSNRFADQCWESPASTWSCQCVQLRARKWMASKSLHAVISCIGNGLIWKMRSWFRMKPLGWRLMGVG